MHHKNGNIWWWTRNSVELHQNLGWKKIGKKLMESETAKINLLLSDLLPDEGDGEIIQHAHHLQQNGFFLWMKVINLWKNGQHKVPISI